MAGFVSGVVTTDGAPSTNTMRVYRADTGELVGATVADAAGYYEVTLLTQAPVFVMAVPASGYAPQMHGPIDPGFISGIPQEGLQVRYSMDDIIGTTLVSETGSYNGVITAATVEPGHVGNALRFNGSTAYVRTDGLPAIGSQRTLCVWFKPQTATPGSSSDGVLMALTNNSDTSINIYYDSTSATFRGKVRWYSFADRGQVDWRGSLTLDTSRFYLLVTKNIGTAASSSLYDDTGVLLRSASVTLSAWAPSAAGCSLFLAAIGAGSALANTTLDGPALYGRSISADEEAFIANEAAPA